MEDTAAIQHRQSGRGPIFYTYGSVFTFQQKAMVLPQTTHI